MKVELTNSTLIAVCAALTLSTAIPCLLLARRHFKDFSQKSIQLLIIKILTLPPLYSLGSTLSLVFPSAAIYLTILIDCYQVYYLVIITVCEVLSEL